MVFLIVRSEVRCPTCRKSNRLPASGVVGLPVNFPQADVQTLALEQQGLPPMEQPLGQNGKICDAMM